MIATVAIAVVALLHVWFLVLEMFLWETPFGLKTLRQSAAQAAQTAILAKNQGLYNGFLAAGLAWALMAPQPLHDQLAAFFLGCVTVAGLYGAATASRTILYLQAIPGALGLVTLFVG